MKIQILQMIEGARKARGLTVVIDVFRAFSLECYLMAKHPSRLCPVGAIEGTVKNPHHINQEKCIKCEACLTNCPFRAIVLE